VRAAPLISAANVVSPAPQFVGNVGVAYTPDTSFVQKCSLSILFFQIEKNSENCLLNIDVVWRESYHRRLGEKTEFGGCP